MVRLDRFTKGHFYLTMRNWGIERLVTDERTRQTSCILASYFVEVATSSHVVMTKSVVALACKEVHTIARSNHCSCQRRMGKVERKVVLCLS